MNNAMYGTEFLTGGLRMKSKISCEEGDESRPQVGFMASRPDLNQPLQRHDHCFAPIRSKAPYCKDDTDKVKYLMLLCPCGETKEIIALDTRAETSQVKQK